MNKKKAAILCACCFFTIGMAINAGAVEKEKLNKTVKNSSVWKDDLKYENWVGSTMIWRDTEKENGFILEIFNSESQFDNKKYNTSEINTIKESAMSNNLDSFQTIPSGQIEKLSIDTTFCGIAIEQSQTDEFEIQMAGMKDKDKFLVETNIKDHKTLEIKAQGPKSGQLYINNSKDKKINTIIIKVPQNKLKQIEIEDETGVIYLNELSAPVIASTINGIIKLEDKQIHSDYDLKCVNGDVILKADTVKYAALACINGNVKASVKTIQQRLDTKTVNGKINVHLTQKPENFSFQPSFAHNTDYTVPDGWKKGYTTGDGSAKLFMSAMNGTAVLTVEQ